MPYQSIQFAPDGDYILDYHEETVERVWARVDDQGSRWLFYPIPFVITDSPGPTHRKRIVMAPGEFGYLEGRTVSTAAEDIREHYYGS